MLPLFVGGVIWVAIVAIFVLVEKVLPHGGLSGLTLILAGLFYLYPG